MLCFLFFVVLSVTMELETFKITVLPLREKLLRQAFRLTGEKADAEDIVQDAFLRLWHIREKLDGYESVEALAMQITKHLAIDRLRTRHEGVPLQDAVIETSRTKDPAEEFENRDAARQIRRIIETLPSLQQTIIRMKDIECYELSEIAEITGSQIEAVRMNLSRARKRVRDEFFKINRK